MNSTEAESYLDSLGTWQPTFVAGGGSDGKTESLDVRLPSGKFVFLSRVTTNGVTIYSENAIFAATLLQELGIKPGEAAGRNAFEDDKAGDDFDRDSRIATLEALLSDPDISRAGVDAVQDMQDELAELRKQ